VRTGEPPLRETPFFTGMRSAVALASVVALLVTGLVLERPTPTTTTASLTDDSLVVQVSGNGIQVKRGGQALGLMSPNLDPSQRVMYSPNAQGSMRARYVDPDTGNVTINNVYAE